MTTTFMRPASRLYVPFAVMKGALGNGDAHVMGMTSEHVLQKLVPGLRKEVTHKSEAEFIQAASAQFLSFWRHS
jgi:hypothetical protein